MLNMPYLFIIVRGIPLDISFLRGSLIRLNNTKYKTSQSKVHFHAHRFEGASATFSSAWGWYLAHEYLSDSVKGLQIKESNQ